MAPGPPTPRSLPWPSAKEGPRRPATSLEPCNHTGRTQPCSTALYAAGWPAWSTPSPIRIRWPPGAEVLSGQGIAVDAGVLAGEAAALNRTWTHLVTTGRPWVTWKLAATLDGRSAAADGTSQWITGEAARADVHRLRAETGAILVGTGTALIDDPQLTARRPTARSTRTSPSGS